MPVEPMAVAVHGMRRARLTANDTIAIVGAGAIGCCAVAVAHAAGATVALHARHDHQRLVGERLGAREIDLGAYDVVVDAAGTMDALEQCVQLAKPCGRVLLLATYWDGMQCNGFAVCTKEREIIPSVHYNRAGPARDIDVAASILAARPAIAEHIITHRFPLDAAAEAIATAADRSAGAIKVVLEP
jgi:threonine dehydrogenase-like Zn-dependent dehydrogenase